MWSRRARSTLPLAPCGARIPARDISGPGIPGTHGFAGFRGMGVRAARGPEAALAVDGRRADVCWGRYVVYLRLRQELRAYV